MTLYLIQKIGIIEFSVLGINTLKGSNALFRGGVLLDIRNLI